MDLGSGVFDGAWRASGALLVALTALGSLACSPPPADRCVDEAVCDQALVDAGLRPDYLRRESRVFVHEGVTYTLISVLYDAVPPAYSDAPESACLIVEPDSVELFAFSGLTIHPDWPAVYNGNRCSFPGYQSPLATSAEFLRYRSSRGWPPFMGACRSAINAAISIGCLPSPDGP